MLTRTRLAAAASPWVRAQLAGPARPAVVLHRGADAVYVRVGTSCIGLLSRSAVAVPCGLRTTAPRLDDLLSPTASAVVGDGRLSLGDLDVEVTRLVDVAVPRGGEPDPAPFVRVVESLDDPRLTAAYADLPETALHALAAADPAAVPHLLGLGGGLTPTGDDVLSGGFAGRHTLGLAPLLADDVTHLAPTRTTPLSAALLDRAIAGEAIPPVQHLCGLLRAPADHSLLTPTSSTTAGRSADIHTAVDALLDVGSSSGAGMLIGLHLALRHPNDRRSS